MCIQYNCDCYCEMTNISKDCTEQKKRLPKFFSSCLYLSVSVGELYHLLLNPNVSTAVTGLKNFASTEFSSSSLRVMVNKQVNPYNGHKPVVF